MSGPFLFTRIATVFVAGVVALARPAWSADFDIAITDYRHGYFTQAAQGFAELVSDGDPRAMFWMGVLYRHGKGVERDVKTARGLYEQAARHGHASAQNNLGLMYRDGVGGRRDQAMAWAWLESASRRGQKNANNTKALLWSELSNAERQAAMAYYEAIGTDIAESIRAKNALRIRPIPASTQTAGISGAGRGNFEDASKKHAKANVGPLPSAASEDDLIDQIGRYLGGLLEPRANPKVSETSDASSEFVTTAASAADIPDPRASSHAKEAGATGPAVDDSGPTTSRPRLGSDRAPGSRYTVQMGIFRNAGNAARLAKRITSLGYPVETHAISVNGHTLQRVRAGRFGSGAAAVRAATHLAGWLELDGLVVRTH